MPKYLFRGRYSAQGAAGLMKEGGTSRQKQIAEMISMMGGELESLYFAFGEYDVVGIVDLPDTVTTAGVSLAVNAGGAVSLTITQLITPEEMDAAGQKVVNYRPPGT
jgi:uncharacterized protein with GYD domain